MELNLTRTVRTDKFTEGKLSIDHAFFCDTIEDKDRDANRDGDLNDPGEQKVYGETAIPAGRYKVILNMSNRFKKIMPLLLDVPGFTGIRIHAGNTATDSHGCILVGVKAGPGYIAQSRKTWERLMPILQSAKDDIYITIS